MMVAHPYSFARQVSSRNANGFHLSGRVKQGRVETCDALRFYSNSNRPFDSIRKWWANSKIFESVLPAKRLEP